MPNPLSADIRARFEVLFSEGLTGREIGCRLMISAASASRLSQRLKRGLRLTPADNPRNTVHGKLAPYYDFLIELIHQDPDITLRELQGALAYAYGVTASVSGIDQALKRLGYTYKKEPIADERKRARVKRARADWFDHRVPAISSMPERQMPSSQSGAVPLKLSSPESRTVVEMFLPPDVRFADRGLWYAKSDATRWPEAATCQVHAFFCG